MHISRYTTWQGSPPLYTISSLCTFVLRLQVFLLPRLLFSGVRWLIGEILEGIGGGGGGGGVNHIFKS